MAFLLNSQAQGVSGKNEQSIQTLWRGAAEARGPMQLHRLKAGPALQGRIQPVSLGEEDFSNIWLSSPVACRRGANGRPGHPRQEGHPKSEISKIKML